MKKVIILGAGVYQVPLIKKAKELGLYVIVVSRKGDYPGFVFADKTYMVDTTNIEEVKKIAEDEQVNGILTTGTDVAVISVGYVCDSCGLKGLSYEASKKCTDKYKMKECFSLGNVRTAQFKKVSFSSLDLNDLADTFRLPFMVKAVDSSGSRGIIRVNDYNKLNDAIQKVKDVTKKDYFIAEEFVQGYEIGVEAYVLDGEVLFVSPHGKYVFHGDADVPLGHYFPFDGTSELISDITEQMNKAISAIGLNNCAVNADMIISDRKAYVLEIGGRAGATCIPETLSHHYGIDYYSLMLNNCIGEYSESDLIPKKAAASKLLVSLKSGVIKSQSFNSFSDQVTVSFDYRIGDYISTFKVGSDRIGHIIAYGKNLAEVENLITEAEKRIHIEII